MFGCFPRILGRILEGFDDMCVDFCSFSRILGRFSGFFDGFWMFFKDSCRFFDGFDDILVDFCRFSGPTPPRAVV